MTSFHPAQPGPITRAEYEERFERLRASMRAGTTMGRLSGREPLLFGSR